MFQGNVFRNWPRQLSQDIILNLYHSLTELALYVLSFLHPRDLLRAAQTCRYWRILAEDNLLWREKCREVRKIVPIIIPKLFSKFCRKVSLLKCRDRSTKLSKGQLISKCPFGIIVWTEYQRKYFWISALKFFVPSWGLLGSFLGLPEGFLVYYVTY